MRCGLVRRNEMLRSSAHAVSKTTCKLITSEKPTPNTFTAVEQTYSHLLRTCTQPSNAQALHAHLIKNSIPFSPFLQNHLLNLYLKLGHVTSALHLFDETPQPNVVSWSSLIKGLAQHGLANVALSFFGRMQRDGDVRPNEFTLVSSLQACSLCCGSSSSVMRAYQVYVFVVRLGFERNVFLTNAMMSVLVRHGEMGEAMRVFEGCGNRDIVSWNAIMAGCAECSCEELGELWWRMNKDEGVKPDVYTFSSVLTGLAAVADVKLGVQVHGQLVRRGHGAEICVGNSLVDMYIKNQEMGDGFRAFDEMPVKDVCSWTEMAAGCLHLGEPRKALEVIGEMKRVGIRANKFTLATALNACANMASLEEGKKFHGFRIKLESCTDMDVCVDNALLDMYAKCGSVDAARCVFESMKDRSVVSWTTMIMACAQNGQAKEALVIFDKMRLQGGIERNHITFICVLYACSLGGFVDEGWKYFDSMSETCGIIRGEDHYACMVNLLGRAGRIKEAEELINNMPMKPGVLVWQTLLSACQLLGDTETGKRAAENALDVNRTDPSTYVLLSNIFAGFSNWDSVGWLRKLMVSRDVKKMPGSSWIEH